MERFLRFISLEEVKDAGIGAITGDAVVDRAWFFWGECATGRLLVDGFHVVGMGGVGVDL